MHLIISITLKYVFIFVEVKSTLSRLRTIKNNKKKATNINEIVVDNTETSKGEKFLIHNQINDNQKRNRNLVFSSPTGIEMLS